MASPAVQCPSLTLEQASQFIELLFSVPLAIFSILCFTYGPGFYTLLFIASLYVLNLNNHIGSRQKIFHITSSIILFILVSAVVACRVSSEGIALFNLWKLVLVPALAADPPVDVANGLMLSTKLQSAGQWLFTFTNTAAEINLIHRTFVVWGSDIKVIVVPVILMLGNLGTGIASRFIADADVSQSVGADSGSGGNLQDKRSIVFSGVFMGVNAFTNLVLTGMIAGRIWYISRQSAKYSSASSGGYSRIYHSIIAIVFESGLLYPTFIILYIILAFGNFPMKDRLNISHASAILLDLLALVAAIAPTLIIVRAGLCITIENTTSQLQGSSGNKPSGPMFSSNAALSTFRAGSRYGDHTTFSDNGSHERQIGLGSLGYGTSEPHIFDSEKGIGPKTPGTAESWGDTGVGDVHPYYGQTSARLRNQTNDYGESAEDRLKYHCRKSSELLQYGDV
ncbi:hypothetical protein D9758_006650 [Tetrapyrgos nigripes]|uniref:Uncharacterized protein n=1 Tax=Tetrapyrgos nigripes TaxID=182062 RepID=A0A8H5GIX1_9AGAR|nr:hypothetical protein D9758_006650 [Tetrapyrgos nigripes]